MAADDTTLWLSHQRVVCALINEWDAIRSWRWSVFSRKIRWPDWKFHQADEQETRNSRRSKCRFRTRYPLPRSTGHFPVADVLFLPCCTNRMQMRCCTSHPFSRCGLILSVSFKFIQNSFKWTERNLMEIFADFTHLHFTRFVNSWSRQPVSPLTPPCLAFRPEWKLIGQFISSGSRLRSVNLKRI